MRHYTNRHDLLSASGDATSTVMDIKDFRHVIIEVVTTGFTGTIKFHGSIAEDIVDLSSGADGDNPHGTIQIKDLEDADAKDGDTGLALTTDTSVNLYEANINALKWFGASVSSHSAGSVTIKVTPFND